MPTYVRNFQPKNNISLGIHTFSGSIHIVIITLSMTLYFLHNIILNEITVYDIIV